MCGAAVEAQSTVWDSSELLSTTGSTPAGFWAHVWAVIEAILWPAFVVYHLLAHIAT